MGRKVGSGKPMSLRGCAFIASLIMLFGTPAFAQDYDLVIANGRVMDPETGFDQVANVGITDGTIVKVSAEKLVGKKTVDATCPVLHRTACRRSGRAVRREGGPSRRFDDHPRP